VHSPTPLPLPPVKDSAVRREHELEREVKAVREVKKRAPVRRSRKEECEAYGRSFEGCGMQSDYDVTTKLGEGTFGYALVIASFCNETSDLTVTGKYTKLSIDRVDALLR
jgi:hypothetical protein